MWCKNFTKFIDEGGKRRAKCNYCVKHFASETKTNGTSTLWNHLNLMCLKSPFRFVDRKQSTLKLTPIQEGGQETGKSSIEKVVYNVEDIRRAIAEFVIIDEQPFKVVEGEGFKNLMAKALPNFELSSRVTVARDCLKIYQREKEKLKKLIKNQHTIAKGIEACTLEWGIENLFTVTLDNASANAAAIKHLKARIDDWKLVILGNEFLHVRCNVHILNLIVKNGLDEQIDPIFRIRNAVKYVKSSSSRFASFKSHVEKVKIDNHGLLSLDVETRRNSIYTMLDTTVKFKKAFTRMYVDDHKYQKYYREVTKGHPSVDDWKIVKAFIMFLNISYQTTLKFSGSLYVTSNAFFHEFFNVRNAIIKYSYNEDLILIDMANMMKGKFDKYWGKFENLNMLLFIAVVLDPGYKMKYVKFILSISYNPLVGKLKSDQVTGALTRLYDHYYNSFSESSNDNSGGETSMVSEVGDILLSRWAKYLEDKGDVEKKML
ncbi:zinc finger BED domain-containing protein RICESLEEPER 2-like [Nicotiana tomentosiformis]|uniref:zinc finger BED domain-containing protein RICESLEEPER 2-like n=1 Tax=Nicotiana tomentosiformis TaxID=4098 RepID=UPI00388C6A98